MLAVGVCETNLGVSPTPRFHSASQEPGWRNDFEDWLRKRYSAENTIKSYMYDVSDFCCWYFNNSGVHFSPERMTLFDAREYRTWLVNVVRCAPSTWERRRASLGMFCKFIQDVYGLAMPKINKLPLMPQTRLAPKSLSQKQRNLIMQDLSISIHTNQRKNKKRPTTQRERWLAMRNRAMLGLMAYSGLRPGEPVRLLLEDVEMGERKAWVTIHGANAKRENTGEVPVMEPAFSFLKEWLEIREEMPIGESKLLFPSATGEEIGLRGLQGTITELSLRLGIDFTAHSLRHTSLTEILDSGADIGVVKAIGRHKKVETTLRYTLPNREKLEAAAERGANGR